MKTIFNYLVILAILTACNKKAVSPDKAPLATVCKIATINVVNNTIASNISKNTVSTYEYDSKDRLVKLSFGTTSITYVYDQKDFLTERITKYSEKYFNTDKFSYNNDRLTVIENILTATEVIKTKTNYEYDGTGNLTKIVNIDENNKQIVSNYKNNILTSKTSEQDTYEVNNQGQITKITTKVSSAFSTAGQFSRYTYDKNGQTIKTENVDKDGIVVASFVNEYSEIKDLQLGFQDYMKGKGFPLIGTTLPKYYIKKETTFLLDRKTNTLGEWVIFTSENYKVDKAGKLLSYSGRYKTTNPKDEAISTVTYNYIDCD